MYKVNRIYLSIIILLTFCFCDIICMKGVVNIAPSEAQKRASIKWDKENMAVVGCKVKKEQAEKFKIYFKDMVKTSNAVLRDYVLDCIDEKDEQEEGGEQNE